MSEKAKQFYVSLEPELRDDLRRRLDSTRWNDAVTADWRYGMDKAFLQALVQHWRDYDFDAAEARLNMLPQFHAAVGGFRIHYVLLKGNGPRPRPLLLMNGWPSSFAEYRKLAPMLADPAAHGSAGDAFDVVMPALPLTAASPPLDAAEAAYRASVAKWAAEEGAYEHVHYTKPQSLAFALADSPVGLASWIVEKFHSWSDHGPDLFETFPADMLLDNLTIYWATETIGSSMRAYYDHAHFRPALQPDDRVQVPTAVCTWPKDLVVPPRSWAERLYDVRQYTAQPRGGHFPAWEAPDAYARDLRQFARSLSKT